VRASDGLANVRYEIRGKLARRALDLERLGYDIVSLNIGKSLRLWISHARDHASGDDREPALQRRVHAPEGHFPAREAVVMQQQERGVKGVTAEEVFIGNGVSELIDLTLRALLNPGDEVLVPSPDYPLWTASVNLNTGRAVHYPCRPARGFVPDAEDIEALITRRTRAIVVVNPNNPPVRCIRGRRSRRSPASRRSIAWWCCATRSTIKFYTTPPSSYPWRPWCMDACCTLSGLSKCTGPAAIAWAGGILGRDRECQRIFEWSPNC